MDSQNHSPTDGVHTCIEIKEAADYLQANGLGTKLRLTGKFKSAERIKQYFHRQGYNVTVIDEPAGSRLVRYNSPSSKGREKRREQKRKYGGSKRDPNEQTLHELLEERSNQIEVGEHIVVKGHEYNISDLLKRRFPEWQFTKSQADGVWTITRTR
jgi:hypothetical protein